MPKQKKGRSRNVDRPQNYWILGTRLIDEEPVTLGAFKPSDRPLHCSRQHAETVASAWASKPDEENGDRPLYQEVLVIAARTDGKGNWNDPKWAESGDILTVVRPGHFEAFGQAAQTSVFSRLQEKILGDKGREWVES